MVDRRAGGIDVRHHAARGGAPAGLEREPDAGLVTGFAHGDHAESDQTRESRARLSVKCSGGELERVGACFRVFLAALEEKMRVGVDETG